MLYRAVQAQELTVYIWHRSSQAGLQSAHSSPLRLSQLRREGQFSTPSASDGEGEGSDQSSVYGGTDAVSRVVDEVRRTCMMRDPFASSIQRMTWIKEAWDSTPRSLEVVAKDIADKVRQ